MTAPRAPRSYKVKGKWHQLRDCPRCRRNTYDYDVEAAVGTCSACGLVEKYNKEDKKSCR